MWKFNSSKTDLRTLTRSTPCLSGPGHAGAAAARADLERRPADWLLPPKPKEDARPPGPEPDAAPFTKKEELIDGIADCVAALLAQRDEKIAELGGKLDAVLLILGAGKSGDIIDLPKNFWRRDAA